MLFFVLVPFWCSAANLPEDNQTRKVQIVGGIPADWTSHFWVEIGDDDLYLFYTGNLYDPVTGVPVTYDLDLTLSGNNGYEVSKVAGNAITPTIQSFTLTQATPAVPVLKTSAIKRDSISFTVTNAAEDHDDTIVHVVPVEIEYVDRDTVEHTWSEADALPSPSPVYSGEQTGDMISWSIGDDGTLAGADFNWKAEGPEVIQGPSGQGKFQWSIAKGDEDLDHDWIDWEPGLYTVTCTVTIVGGAPSVIRMTQEVGVRSHDVVVVGWIDPKKVPLDIAGVAGDVTSFYPPTGNFTSVAQKLLTLAHLGLVSQGFTDRPVPAVAMNLKEREYIVNWLFKYGGNPIPRIPFANEGILDVFRMKRTRYKLFNRSQVKFLLNAARDGFKVPPIVLKGRTAIGVTEEPIFGLEVAGVAGPDEGKQQIKNNKTYYQTNDGSPDDNGVDAINTLLAPSIWNHIGSTISFGVDLGLTYEILYQKYPSFFVYELRHDGSFEWVKWKSQAPNPKDNFNINPYDPPLMGPAPFIIP